MITTKRYEEVHGRRPRGIGRWLFCLPGEEYVTYEGRYIHAATAVIAYAKIVEVETITLVA